MFMLSKHEILAQAVWTWDGATFIGLFSDTSSADCDNQSKEYSQEINLNV